MKVLWSLAEFRLNVDDSSGSSSHCDCEGNASLKLGGRTGATRAIRVPESYQVGRVCQNANKTWVMVLLLHPNSERTLVCCYVV